VALFLTTNNILFNKLGRLGDRCRSFDADAKGYALSEGCGVLVLKRLADAVANR
jgi:acyl transferase domain-containing protein